MLSYRRIIYSLLLLTLLTNTLSTHAQLSKTPNLSGDQLSLPTQDPFVLPEDYPEDILEHFNENIDARSFIVVDVETNRVLAEKQGNTRYPIASMSKLAATYLVYQAVEEGRISLTDEIDIPKEIEDYMSFNPEMSAMGLYSDLKYTVEDLLAGVLIMSGNDATSALMWHLYGSEQAGVAAIRELLLSWGITNFEFYTVSGIPNQYIPESWWVEGSNETSENQMTAADVALMAEYLVRDFPEVLDITSAESYTVFEGKDNEFTMYNTNLLLPGATYGRDGIKGLKSGNTDAAGKNFVAYGQENGRNIIAVAMGVFDRADLEISTYWEIEILLNKLADYPDLYQNELLPTNLPDTPQEEVSNNEDSNVTEDLNLDDDIQALLESQGISGENRRDNPITNFMRNIFNIFK